MRVLVVTPTYEEAANIEEHLRRVRAAVPEADVLVVDDNSPDGTGAIAERVAQELGQIEVLHRLRKEGLGEAYRAGLGVGVARGYDRLVQIDADLSHDANALPGMLRVLDDVDLVIGSRYVEGGAIPHWPWYRRGLSRYGNRYAGIVLGHGIHDATSGYRAYRADTLTTIDFASTRSKGYGFQIEAGYRVWLSGAEISEVPIVFADRVRGYSKMTWGVFAEELLLVTWWGVRDLVKGKRRRRRRLPCRAESGKGV